MRISKDKIEEIRAALDIVDVVSDYVQLRQRGSNYFGLCPFHSEKTASFSVNPSLGIYKCFGCGVAGDAFQFVMAVENVSFVDAARVLSEKAGISLPEDDHAAEATSEADAIHDALRFAAGYYYRCLTSDERGRSALAYLRDRGFTAATIKAFGLGFAPDSWDALHTAATDAHYSSDVLEKSGLIVPRKDASGFYDRFRNRITFPILSHMGKVLGFGARILKPDPRQPKYLNSPETAVYHKGKVLYGLYQARQQIRSSKEVILVEGYTDVMALHQAGVENVVASSGTALTTDQVRLLHRYAERIILLYDADAAGDAAALRGAERILQEGASVYAVSLPNGQDPDSFIRDAGAEAFRDYVSEHRQDFIEFRYSLAARGGALKSPDERARVVGELLDLIQIIPEPLAQESYLRRAAEVTGMPMTTLWRGLEQRRAESSSTRRIQRTPERREVSVVEPSRPFSGRENSQRASSPERETHPAELALIRLMLEGGEPMVEFVLGHMSLAEFSEGHSRDAVESILTLYHDDRLDERAIMEKAAPAVREFLAGILTDRVTPSINWSRKLKINVPRLNESQHVAAAGAMTQLKLFHLRRQMQSVSDQVYAAQQAGDDVSDLQEQTKVLNDLRKQIERQEFINWPETAIERSAG